MTVTLIISILTFIGIICGVLFFPVIRIKKFHFDSFWFISLIGALLLLIFGKVNLIEVGSNLLSDTEVNPIKILTLFVSMTVLSIFLDEVGFFRYLASLAHKKAKNSQLSLFLSLYAITSILTIFTSNDIIILTFTPFICYFSKRANINPIPYLIGEFVAANSWSMMLVIGNPTNIYLATMYNIGFVEYMKVMFLPTIVGSLVAFLFVYLIFRKELKKPMIKEDSEVRIADKGLLIIGLIHLACCTVILAISSYVSLPMWIISLFFMVSLIVCVIIYCLIKGKTGLILKKTLYRAPWNLIPFLISMFIIVLALDKYDITNNIAQILGNDNIIYKYGIASFFSSNLINNIPMSVLYSQILSTVGPNALIKGVYATIVGSNLGALFSPIGALAGIMWMSILQKLDVKLKFGEFMKYNFIPSILALISTLIMLNFVLNL